MFSKGTAEYKGNPRWALRPQEAGSTGRSPKGVWAPRKTGEQNHVVACAEGVGTGPRHEARTQRAPREGQGHRRRRGAMQGHPGLGSLRGRDNLP